MLTDNSNSNKLLAGFPSLVKGARLKIACLCFVGSNPTSANRLFDQQPPTRVAQWIRRVTSNHKIASSSLVVGIYLLTGVPCYINTRLGSIPRVIIYF